MAFIEKKDPIVLNIKLTSKGRELLSKGQLTFKYYAIGDSEIDYEFNRNAGFNPFYSNILRPADRNPQQLSFIPRDLSGDSYNEITAVPCTPTTVVNQVQPIGFFNDNTTEFLTDSDHVKQPDIAIAISGVTGGTQLLLQKAPTYQANPNEPAENDLLLIKWTNPLSISTTGYTVNKSFPTPYLWYRIQTIVSGSLAGNNLIVEVDRNLPNFSGITGGSNSILAGAMVYYNFINYTGDTCYSTDETDDALIAFLQNCQCPTVTFPFWNMSIVFTENIAGVDPTEDKSFGDYNTKGFGGFVSYIQNQAKDDENYKRKLGVIHYTNNSVANTYGEGFYGDPLNVLEASDIPTLNIPTVMWHKSSGATLGLELRATGSLKYLTGVTKSLNTRYFDLADPSGNIVGKVFYGLKIFVIEDQELLFAMSYKSNRSWTLPDYGVDINANVTFGCPACLLQYTVTTVPPTTLGGSDGQIIISGITNSSLDSVPPRPVILEILSGGTGNTGATKVYFSQITGDTIVNNTMTLNGFGLSAITYTVNLIDTGFVDCIVPEEIDLSDVSSKLAVYGEETTYSGLNPYFKVSAYANNPTRIRLSSGITSNGFGMPFGSAYITVAPTGTTNAALSGRTSGTTGNDALTKWVKVESSYLEITNLTFLEPYQIFVRDAAITGNFTEIMNASAVTSQIWTYYIAKASSFVDDPNNVVLTTGSDSGGNYVVVSNYLKTINPAVNPIIGEIEMSVYDENELPIEWVSTSNDGSPVKIYYTGQILDNAIKIRERYDYINMYEITIIQ